MELTALTIHKARDLLRSGEITSVELTRTYLDRIEALDPGLRAFISVLGDRAMARAARADARLAADPEA
ncbi:Asp-tRNA(Asn)/Glu-tRNA(Gln) amidotransferase subunit GatA, partial [Thermodesulfobacteriota bacterium]